MATDAEIQGIPISDLPRENNPAGVDIPGVKSGLTVKVSLDTKADKSVVDALQSGVIRQPAVDTYNDASGGKTSLLSQYPAPLTGWDVIVKTDETKEGRSNRYNWNGTIWVDMGAPVEYRDFTDPLRFESGTYASQPDNTYLPADSPNRARSVRFPLIDGVTYGYSLLSGNYTLIARIYEDASGTLRSFTTSSIIGDSNHKAIYFVVRKNDSSTITGEDLPQIEMSVSYTLNQSEYVGVLGDKVEAIGGESQQHFEQLQGEISLLERYDLSDPLRFELGTIASQPDGTYVFQNSINRARSIRYPLIDGVAYTIALMSGDYTLRARLYEDSAGILKPFYTDSITGDSSHKALYFAVGKVDNSDIWPEDTPSIQMVVNYTLPREGYVEHLEVRVTELQNEQPMPDNNFLLHQLNDEDLFDRNRDDEIEVLQSNLDSLLKARKQGTFDSETLPLKSNGNILILNLHKRANAGYGTVNDVYLPNAEDDFSDVRIKDDKGNFLPCSFIFRGDVDILPDTRVPKDQLVHMDSAGNMISQKDGYIKKSGDNGLTWTAIPCYSSMKNAVAAFVDDQDNIFAGLNGKLYKASAPYTAYTEVFDFTTVHSDAIILSHSMCQHPDGDLFIGTYQTAFDARIYRSTNSGNTWAQVFQTSTYQHVHNMSVDLNVNPVAIYAGLDGGGAILVSTDKGSTWVDLRAQNPNIPQSTDYGMIYSDPSGYRLFGGETSIVGGASILKSTDNVNFRPVLQTGKAVYFVKKLAGKLFAGGISSGTFRSAEIYVSEDEGETWKTAYSTSHHLDAGASDGFRYLSQGIYAGASEEQIIVGCQAVTNMPLRILSGHFASVLVRIPSGCESLTVESGYMVENNTRIYNSSRLTGDILQLDFNEDNEIIKERVSGTFFRNKNFEFINDGQRLGAFHPAIIEPAKRKSFLFKNEQPLRMNLDLSGSDFTLSFFGGLKSLGGSNNDLITLLRYRNITLNITTHNLRFGTTSAISFNYPQVDVSCQYDLYFRPDGYIEAYRNGVLRTVSSASFLTQIGQMSGVVEVFPSIGTNAYMHVQNFAIRRGGITQEEALRNYYDNLSDNY